MSDREVARVQGMMQLWELVSGHEHVLQLVRRRCPRNPAVLLLPLYLPLPLQYCAFEDDRYIYQVMEYASGGNLRQWIEDQGGVLGITEPRFVKMVLAPLLKCIRHMHGILVQHNDLKPGAPTTP